jgi:hypothetical protein
LDGGEIVDREGGRGVESGCPRRDGRCQSSLSPRRVACALRYPRRGHDGNWAKDRRIDSTARTHNTHRDQVRSGQVRSRDMLNTGCSSPKTSQAGDALPNTTRSPASYSVVTHRAAGSVAVSSAGSWPRVTNCSCIPNVSRSLAKPGRCEEPSTTVRPPVERSMSWKGSQNVCSWLEPRPMSDTCTYGAHRRTTSGGPQGMQEGRRGSVWSAQRWER